MLFCRLMMFKINYIEKFFRKYHLESSSLDPDQARHWSGLIWVQSVCKSYLQTTLVGKALMSMLLNLTRKYWLLTIRINTYLAQNWISLMTRFN